MHSIMFGENQTKQLPSTVDGWWLLFCHHRTYCKWSHNYLTAKSWPKLGRATGQWPPRTAANLWKNGWRKENNEGVATSMQPQMNWSNIVRKSGPKIPPHTLMGHWCSHAGNEYFKLMLLKGVQQATESWGVLRFFPKLQRRKRSSSRVWFAACLSSVQEMCVYEKKVHALHCSS